MKKIIDFLKLKKLEIAVFICGAVVMIFEIVGSRVVGPYLGTSIYVWTSLIGVILGSLSIGYWLGGKIADKKISAQLFSFIILFSAIAILVMNFIRDFVLDNFPYKLFSIEISSLIVSILLFAPASVILGMISPYAVKLKMKSLDMSARIAGNLMAVSTVGSIVGTFAAGFIIIPLIGTNLTLNLLALVLFITAVGLKFTDFKTINVFFIFMIFISTVFNLNYFTADINKNAVVDIDTEYNRVKIFRMIDKDTNKPILALSTDPFGIQSGMFFDSDDLVFDYLKRFDLIKHFVDSPNRVLLLGGCAYSYPKYFLKNFPETSTIDVVEIDSGITKIARKYFRLKDNSRLKIYHEDARTFINQTNNKYDAILIDAYNSYTSIPFQLTTIEIIKKLYSLLNNEGVVILNLISAIEGDKGRFFQSEYKTYKAVFPQVYVFQVKDFAADKTQNLIIVALKSDIYPLFSSSNEELNRYLSQKLNVLDNNLLPILTDDYAPVEFYQYRSL